MNQICSKCNITKEFFDFHKLKSSPTGYKKICKACHKDLYGIKSDIKKKLERELIERKCDFCNNAFFGRARKYCSDNCQSKAKSYKHRAKLDRKTLELLKLRDQGFYKCKSCGTVGERKDKYYNDNLCLSCKNKSKRAYRKNHASSESITKKAELRKRKSKLLDKKINNLFDNVFKTFINNCQITQVTNQFYSKTPWKNPNLSNSEKYRIRYRFDSDFNAKERLRRQLKKSLKFDGIADTLRLAAVKNGKSNKVEQVLGFTIKEFRERFEQQFTNGMTWEKFNSGDIHIDHITPKSWFSYTSVNDLSFKKCWSLQNLQPLWAKDNLTKSNKYSG